MKKLLVLIGCVLFSGIAAAQSFPSKPVRLIVPFPPGGATDIIGRLVAAKMSEVWGQAVVVENKPGAGTVVGTDTVAKAAPDGYTLGMVVTSHVINPSLRSNLPYDTLKDLAPVTQVSAQHMAILAHPSFEANDIAGLIALAKKNPGNINYATSGAGTALHLTMEMLKTAAGIDIVHVPYRGGAQATQAAVGGQVPIVLEIIYAAKSSLDAGKLKPLAVLSPQRTKEFPNVPTIAETVPGVSAVSMVGIVAPGATPRPLVQKISADIAQAVRASDLTGRMVQVGMEPVGSAPEQFDAFIRNEMQKWAPVVKASGAKVD
jgi:tripartite-type tricarboxylate transporter receptor subunit TctC